MVFILLLLSTMSYRLRLHLHYVRTKRNFSKTSLEPCILSIAIAIFDIQVKILSSFERSTRVVHVNMPRVKSFHVRSH